MHSRAQFNVEPFLRDVKNRRGLVDFSVLCDETNNTDTVMTETSLYVLSS